MGGKGRGKGTVSGVVKAMREKGRKRSWHEGREGSHVFTVTHVVGRQQLGCVHTEQRCAVGRCCVA